MFGSHPSRHCSITTFVLLWHGNLHSCVDMDDEDDDAYRNLGRLVLALDRQIFFGYCLTGEPEVFRQGIMLYRSLPVYQRTCEHALFPFKWQGFPPVNL